MHTTAVIVLCFTLLPSPSFLSRDPPPPPHLPWAPPPTPTQTKCAHKRSKSGHSNKVKCFNYKICTKRLGRIFCSEQKLTDATGTNPYLAIRATDLPSPSFLFSHFTGRYWFPVLFFLLHVLVGPHLFLIQQAGSLEFTFLPDKLPSQTKRKEKS